MIFFKYCLLDVHIALLHYLFSTHLVFNICRLFYPICSDFVIFNVEFRARDSCILLKHVYRHFDKRSKSKFQRYCKFSFLNIIHLLWDSKLMFSHCNIYVLWNIYLKISFYNVHKYHFKIILSLLYCTFCVKKSCGGRQCF